ncbi:MAG: addiction module protein [Polyangiaceae bacterium]|nr:addiction module protein [Polyangiaceae bacterium]
MLALRSSSCDHQVIAEERLELLDTLWASLGRDPTAFPLDEAQKSELEQRLRDLRVEGPTGFSWDEVVAQARKQGR